MRGHRKKLFTLSENRKNQDVGNLHSARCRNNITQIILEKKLLNFNFKVINNFKVGILR